MIISKAARNSLAVGTSALILALGELFGMPCRVGEQVDVILLQVIEFLL
jgi:hypothetical protein